MFKRCSLVLLLLPALCTAQIADRPVAGRWSLDLGGGWSHRTAGIDDLLSDQLKEYAKGLVNGWHVSGGFTREVNSKFGIGLSLDHARWQHSDPMIALIDVYGEAGNYELEDRISTTFFGVGLRLRHGSEQGRTHLDTDVDVGYAGYHHLTLVGPDRLTLNGGNMALRFRFGIDTRLADRTSLLIGFSYLHARIGELKVDDREGSRWIVLFDRAVSLHRLDISAGLRFLL